MTKVCTNSYVFKFVGGEPKQKRLCHYCRKEKTGGMICVYGNAPDSRDDDAIFVCPGCVVKGCKESERQWAALYKKAMKSKAKPIPTCASGGDCMAPGGCGNPVQHHKPREGKATQ